MDKLYSKPLLVIKAIYCICLCPLNVLISSYITVEDAFIYLMLCAVPVGCLFTVPFWFSAVYLKKYIVTKIGKYVLLDALSCVVPAIFGVLFTEIVYTIISETTVMAGIVTAIFTVIFIIVALVFWLIYLILSRQK